MKLTRWRYFGPEDNAASALENTFGTLDRVDPSLSHAEDAYRQTLQPPPEQKPPEPEPQPETAPGEPGEEAPDETAREDAAPEEREEPAGDDSESAGDVTEAVLDSIPPPKDPDVSRILAKFNRKPESLAVALKGALNLQNRTAAERKEVQSKLEKFEALEQAAAKFLVPTEDGGYEPRPEYFQPPPQTSQNGEIDPKSVRAGIVAKMRAQFSQTYDDDDVETLIEAQAPIIEEYVNAEVNRLTTERKSAHIARTAQVGEMVNRHFQQHPEDESSLQDEINEFYRSFPDPHEAVLRNYGGGISRVADLLRMEKQFPEAVRSAYEEGWKDREKAVNAAEADAATPTGAARSPRSRKPSGADQDAEMKRRLIEGDGLIPLESIFE